MGRASLLLALCPRSHYPPLSLLACLQYPALKVPLSLGKDCGGGRRENQLITPRLEKIDSFLSVE